jgi:hypothetical protein
MTPDEFAEEKANADSWLIEPATLCRCGHGYWAHGTTDDGEIYEKHPCCQTAEKCFCMNFELPTAEEEHND